MGRPKESIAYRIEQGKLDKDWEEKITDLAAEGASDVELRLVLDISDDLWYRWIDEEPDFSRTVKRCKALCQVWWERQGRKMSSGESDGNATTWIFNTKNRFGWKDKTETEHSGNIGVTQITRRIIKPTGDGTGN